MRNEDESEIDAFGMRVILLAVMLVDLRYHTDTLNFSTYLEKIGRQEIHVR